MIQRLAVVAQAEPTAPNGGPANLKRAYAQHVGRIGTVPPPLTAKGAMAAGFEALKGHDAFTLLDRMGERLAEDTDKPELSASAGVAIYPRDGGTPTTLLSAADRALYAVKADKAAARRRGVVPIREWTNAASR